jgi:hypothetical protein
VKYKQKHQNIPKQNEKQDKMTRSEGSDLAMSQNVSFNSNKRQHHTDAVLGDRLGLLGSAVKNIFAAGRVRVHLNDDGGSTDVP